MARAGFYNENEYRDYPFQSQVYPLSYVRREEVSSSSSSSSSSAGSAEPYQWLPHSTIVDFGAIMAVNSAFLEAEDWAHLNSIERNDPYLRFEFGNTANAEVLVFHRRIDASEFQITWSQSRSPLDVIAWPSSASSSSSSSSSSASSEGLFPTCDEAAYEGYLVTGELSDLLDILLDGETLLFNYHVWAVEPARVQSLLKSYVKSVNLANRDRSHVTLPERCLSSSSSAAEETVPIYINQTCMQGELEFKEGYNCTIRQEDVNNTIVISGAPGRNGPTVGPNCEEFPFYPGEGPLGDSPFFTGGPACGEIIKTINGKGGRRLRIHAGPGFQIATAIDNQSRLIIDASLHDFAICTGSSSGGI